MTHPSTQRRDDGAILVITLILTLVLAIIVIALASFVTVGIRTSSVTDGRSETNADGAAVITWAMEAFRRNDLVLTDCGFGPASVITPPSAAINVNGSTTELTCEVTAPDGAFPVVHLRATAEKNGIERTVQAVAQFAPGVAVRALDWKIDDSALIFP